MPYFRIFLGYLSQLPSHLRYIFITAGASVFSYSKKLFRIFWRAESSPRRSELEVTTPPNDSFRAIAISGWIIIILFFGVIGTWSLIAPLNGAVVSNGFVKVESNRKSVQHLDGGIVKERSEEHTSELQSH